MKGREVHFARIPISVPCPVPVLPGTPDTMRDGDAIPMEERTERCHVDAFWFIGGQPTCDVHLRVACGLLEVDYDDLCAEAGGPFTSEEKPWSERYRYPQSDAVDGPPDLG
jgi:hypothetical protein